MAEGEKEAIQEAIDILVTQYQKDMDEAKESGWSPSCPSYCPNERLYQMIRKLRGH